VTKYLSLAGLFLIAVIEAAATPAAPIQLGWNAAPDASVRGYAIYCGATNVTTMTRIDAGSALTCTLSNLVVGVTYRIYAVSYDASGMESIPSNEVFFTPTKSAVSPVASGPRVTLSRQTDGSMKLNYTATPGQVCGIQFTATLNPPHWQTLTNVTANSLSNVMALDISAKDVPQRFYRVALAPQPLISAVKITRLPSGAMQLDWTAPPNSVCRVLRASTPTASSWATQASSIVADAEGRATYTDRTAMYAGSRFYRVAMP